MRYVVIGRTLDYDDPTTPTSPDPLYSGKTLGSLAAGEVKKARLNQIRRYDGKRFPTKDHEYDGSYLAVVEPEYVEWTSTQEQYPIVLDAEGDWGVTTTVTPPEGFVSDYPSLSTTVADTVGAVQFTITDIGSSWTKTKIQHTITHKGQTKKLDSDVPMFDKKPKKTLTRNDNVAVGQNSSGNVIDVLANDTIEPPATQAVAAVTQGAYGTVTISGNGTVVIYTPNEGFTGIDHFDYSVDDGSGGPQITATVKVRVTR